MEEKKKIIRLKQAATEFNVGISTVVEYLTKKGFTVDDKPNTRITPEQYESLSQAFRSEREVKENADKIEIATGGNNMVVEASHKKNKKDETEEITIKNYTAPHPTINALAKTKAEKTSPANAPGETSESQVETDEGPIPSADEKGKEQPATQQETGTTSEQKTEVASMSHDDALPHPAPSNKTEADKPKFEPQVITASVSGTKEGSEAYNAELKIVDKIDLSGMDVSTRANKKKTDKKKKTQKVDDEKSHLAKDNNPPLETQEKPEHKAAEVEIVDALAASLPVTQDEPIHDEIIIEPKTEMGTATEDETSAVETPTQAETGEGSPTDFIKTEYQKLEGPKVIAKIDVSQFESTTHRRKRKHMKKEGVKVDTNAIQEGTGKKEKGPKKNDTHLQSGTPQQGQDKKSIHNEKKKSDKKKKKGGEKKVEVDDAEIEKQIRETLARLNPLGKSKTSKHNREKRAKVQELLEREQLQEQESQNTLQVTEFVTANELATMMKVPVTKIIATCMSVGIFVSINQRLDAETIQLIADEFGYKINFVSSDVVSHLNAIEQEDRPEDIVPRSPIVTVMGHVDHGKTSLLDYIRNTNVIAGEAGGITQHIGAYEVTLANGRRITFLDTPGHEAFTAMRARGAKVTDIAIIVIAADDKIMPQTIEAINHAQAAAVPIIFAINKIDKPGADPERIKTELANMNLLVEDWGGKYQSQDISAKKGINVDLLLEKVLLQADIMELKGNPNKRAKGAVLESALDKGRGFVAKILVQDGTIRQGDPILAGSVFGKVKAMYNERNQLMKEAGPSQPVLLLGLDGAPQAGDSFNVTETEKEAKDLAAKRMQLQREQSIRTTKHLTLDDIGRRIAIGNFKELNLIVKADVDGTVEALSDSLLKLSNEEVQVNVVHKAVGQITESDVLLAEASDAIIIGFQVRPSIQARRMAEAEKIDIRLYSIIYDAINELQDAIEGMLAPETQTKIIANLEIRETFKISHVGTIGGCMCLEGKIQRNSNVRLIRDGIVVYTGKLASLKRFKDDVKEVVSGQDCGLSIENYNDIKVGDIVEAYETIEIKRTIK
ncbi:MAG: translation initiation factor IF-2 [Bacteroidales bacterium]|nr:translation initiation factor IF-2 [Bacteroidales bacterium]